MSPAALASDDAKSDLTPMIDVVFLMVIFFVCIDFRVLEAKLPAYLPRDVGGGPSQVEPQEQLRIEIFAEAFGVPTYAGGATSASIDPNTGRPRRFVLRDHRVRWQVGPRQFADFDAMQRELVRLANDPAQLVRDPRTDGRKLMAGLVLAHPGVCYDDVARVVDAAHAAGFQDIHFGGGLGPARR
ncbi:MAG: biopolymer transporter ExbD [Planctomycetes bacterium]|nr:biopolymer transporter ExbD [Planctomycetota bacterium]